MGHVRIAAVHAPGRDHAQRRFVVFHVTHLHWRGVRAQQPVGVEIKGIVHRPRRVVRRDIERLEIVVVVLDLRSVGEFETHAREQRFKPLERARDRMQSARAHAPPRQRDVDFFGRNLARARLRLQRRAPFRQRAGECLLGIVDQLADGRTLFGRQAAQVLELFREHAFLAQVMHAQCFHGAGIRGRVDARTCLGEHLRELLL